MGSAMRLVRIRRDDADALRWLHEVMRRIRAMVQRHSGDHETFVTQVWTLLAQRSPYLGLWAGVEHDRLVGHMVATVQQWDHEYVGWVHQLEMDRPSTQAEWDAGMEALREWAADASHALVTQGATLSRLLMTTPHNPKVFMRRGGWQPFRTMMTAPLLRGTRGGA